LLAVPPDHINDSKNKVRAAVGNGLRPEIWEQFQTRFNIDAIAEFYGSTEGFLLLFLFFFLSFLLKLLFH